MIFKCFVPGTPPTIVPPPNGGYWIEGGEDGSVDDETETRPQPGTPRQSRRHTIDTDDTAKFYRRFFLGKVCLCYVRESPKKPDRMSG